ncbi:MAG: hypothetical protein KIT17_09625 [Rubrivivax sp.]|nr:hypothetical protein [Rubrivivax sp.]
MSPSSRKVVAIALLPSVATMLFVQACGGGGLALAQEAADPIEGVWENVITQRDCNSQAALATFRGMQVYHRGGTLADTSGAPTTTRSAGFGLWQRSGNEITTRFRFFRYNADGSLAGSTVVTRTVTPAADGMTVAGHSQTALLDVAGNEVARGCATDTGTRFR